MELAGSGMELACSGTKPASSVQNQPLLVSNTELDQKMPKSGWTGRFCRFRFGSDNTGFTCLCKSSVLEFNKDHCNIKTTNIENRQGSNIFRLSLLLEPWSVYFSLSKRLCVV